MTLTIKKISLFWIPLAATWLMMAVEGPFLAAVIARLVEPKFNLAAYGVAFSIALLFEAPIIMIMTASTALVKDRESLLKLRNFTYGLNTIVTLVMLLLLVPPLFHCIMQDLVNLPDPLARLTYQACVILLPWPAAIGYRRFYQGVLIRSNLTRRVAYGTIVRLLTMAAAALTAVWLTDLQGALVGAVALSSGVCAEAAASRLMARAPVHHILDILPAQESRTGLTYGSITEFYTPLALTSILALGVNPLVTFFLGHSRMAIESLAVLPVITSLIFIFRSMGLSFQEVGIALLGEEDEGYPALKRFAVLLGFAVLICLALVAFTPLSHVWFHYVSGLSLELDRFATLPTRILTGLPVLMVLLAFQRAVLVKHRQTRPITVASAIELAGIMILLPITIKGFGMVGAVAAALSLLIGRLLANTYLFVPFLRVVRKRDRRDARP